MEYTYLDNLNKSISRSYKEIYICAYNICNKGRCPFLTYLLCDNGDGLQFPVIYDADNNIIDITKKRLFDILQIELNKNFFKGFIDNDDILHVFYEVTDCTLIGSEHTFCLIDEIVNTRTFLDKPIDSAVTHLFLHNPLLCFLTDAHNNKYEIPSVSYVGRPEHLLNFTYTFGVSRTDSILGYSYYFTDFQNAQKEFGVVRNAIFYGVVLLKQNFPNDDIDASHVKNERLVDYALNTKYEAMTLRISDYDGLWTHNYDSVYLGNTELDDGTFLQNTPIIALKEYNQHIPLSIHIIQK